VVDERLEEMFGNELKTDYHIPLIARNHADRILKKIEK